MRDDNEYELLGSEEVREGEEDGRPPVRRRVAALPHWWRYALAVCAGAVLLSLLHPSVRHVLSSSGVDVDPSLRKAQLSQLRLLREHVNLINDQGRASNLETLDGLEACLSGKTRCPKKPVILSNYPYVGMYMENNPPGGEIIWLSSVIPMMKDEGYFILHTHEYAHWIAISRIIPDLVHIYFSDELGTTGCVYDPRCAAAYQAPENSTDLSIGVPDEEMGMIPLARLFAMTWYGTYPASWGNDFTWLLGIKGDRYWTYNPLGPRWTLTPYAFPNNTFLPWSIEKTCMKSSYLPHEERNETALIFAKHAGIFEYARIKPSFWSSDLVTSQNFTFLSTASPEDGKPVPEGLTSLGMQTRPAYNALLASVKAVVGIGKPKTSPTVFSALCEGTSVVMPIYVDRPQTEEKDFWGDYYSQHSMAITLGPPYVYPYVANNETSLIDAVDRALATAPGRYIPPMMREPWVRSKIKEVLATDFEALAAEVIAENGGIVPRPDGLINPRPDRHIPVMPAGSLVTWASSE